MKLFKSNITQKQIDEIMSIGMDGHTEALAAYGSEMYKSGIIKGAIATLVGMTIGSIGTTVYNCVKAKQNEKEPT